MANRVAEEVMETEASSGAVSRSTRRRPGDQQRVQKEQTRAKLLEAARIVFDEQSYTKTSVDMIAEEAGVSRTTFYRHFDGKLAVAMALFGNMADEIDHLWDELFALKTFSKDDIHDWLVRHIFVIESDPVMISVLRELEATEAEAQPVTLQHHGRVIAKMWDEDLLSAESKDGLLWGRSLLLLLQIDQFLFAVCARNWTEHREILTAAMAELLFDFLAMRREKLAD